MTFDGSGELSHCCHFSRTCCANFGLLVLLIKENKGFLNIIAKFLAVWLTYFLPQTRQAN